MQEFTWIRSSMTKLQASRKNLGHGYARGQRNLFPYMANNKRRTNTTVITENCSASAIPVALSSSVFVITFTSNAIAKWACPTGDLLFCSQLLLFTLQIKINGVAVV